MDRDIDKEPKRSGGREMKICFFGFHNAVFLQLFASLFLFMEIGVADEGSFKVVFLGESSSKDDVWLYRIECMREAAKNIDLEFSFHFAEGDYVRHAQMIEDEVARGANAIIGPWWDATVYNHAIINAVKQGVIIYGFLGTEPRRTLSDDIIDKLGWTETNWNKFGRQLAEIAVDCVPEGGKILWPAETSVGSYIVDAIDGFKYYYSEHGLLANIDVIEIGFDLNRAVSQISKHLSVNQQVCAIITSGAIAINAANIAVKEMSLLPNDIALIGQVVSPAAVRGIAEGYMRAGLNLELTHSSYDALLDVLAATKLSATPRRSVIDFVTITKENVATVIPRALQY
jgi:ABC-type sugar transport system substrate-binding protein